jgi:2-keto-3-deoxy-L-rhamnonate aldolase RhmA
MNDVSKTMKARLRNGELLYGIMLSELYAPNLARLLARCGYDYLLLDCEHGYYDMTQVANIIAVADGVNMPVLVRVSQPSRTTITKYLDMGARGILLSNCAGVEAAKALVNISYYAPQGDRGISTFRAHTGYDNGNVPQIMQEANKRNLVICQIEAPETVDMADEILAVEGVDGLLVGPNDLSQHMGIFGQLDHPKLAEAMRRIADASKRAGKWSGVITANQMLLKQAKALGMTCFSAGSELSALCTGATRELERIKAL